MMFIIYLTLICTGSFYTSAALISGLGLVSFGNRRNWDGRIILGIEMNCMISLKVVFQGNSVQLHSCMLKILIFYSCEDSRHKTRKVELYCTCLF